MNYPSPAEGSEDRQPAPFRPLQAIVALGGIQALTMLAGLTRTKVLALLLGPDGVGIIGVIDQAVALITHVGTLSLPVVALKYLSQSSTRGGDAFAQLYKAIRRLLLVASLGALAIGLGLAFWHPELLGAELIGYQRALIAAVVAAPVLATIALCRSVLAAMDRNRQAALFALAGGIALVASAYVGIRAGGLLGFYLANLFVQALQVIVVLVYIGRSESTRTTGGQPGTLAVLRSHPGLGTFVTGIHALTLATPVAYLIARVMVLSQHGAVAAGLFSSAYGLALAMRVVLNQANGLYLWPLLNRPHGKPYRVAAAAEYLRVLLVVLFVASALVTLFARDWLVLLYSRQFAAAAGLVAVFIVSEGLLLVAGVYQALLIGFNDLRAHLAISIAANVCIGVMAVLLIPELGPIGAGYAFIAGHGLILVASAAWLRYAHNARQTARAVGPVVGGMVLVAAVAYWVQTGELAVWFKLVVLGVVGLGLLTLLTPQERRWLVAPWRGAPANVIDGLDADDE